jgi:hypothetical protein
MYDTDANALKALTPAAEKEGRYTHTEPWDHKTKQTMARYAYAPLSVVRSPSPFSNILVPQPPSSPLT